MPASPATDKIIVFQRQWFLFKHIFSNLHLHLKFCNHTMHIMEILSFLPGVKASNGIFLPYRPYNTCHASFHPSLPTSIDVQIYYSQFPKRHSTFIKTSLESHDGHQGTNMVRSSGLKCLLKRVL